MKRFIGKFLLGHETINLFVDTATCAARAETPGWVGEEKTAVGEIVVGIRGDKWHDALEGLLHEAEEYLMAKRLHRFEADLAISDDSSNCLFVMNHAQFQDMICTTACFLSDCWPAISKAFEREKRHRKAQAAKKKKRKRK